MSDPRHVKLYEKLVAMEKEVDRLRAEVERLTGERDEARGLYKSCMDRNDWKDRATELRKRLALAEKKLAEYEDG